MWFVQVGKRFWPPQQQRSKGEQFPEVWWPNGLIWTSPDSGQLNREERKRNSHLATWPQLAEQLKKWFCNVYAAIVPTIVLEFYQEQSIVFISLLFMCYQLGQLCQYEVRLKYVVNMFTPDTVDAFACCQWRGNVINCDHEFVNVTRTAHRLVGRLVTVAVALIDAICPLDTGSSSAPENACHSTKWTLAKCWVVCSFCWLGFQLVWAPDWEWTQMPHSVTWETVVELFVDCLSWLITAWRTDNQRIVSVL